MDFAGILYHDLGKAVVMMQSWMEDCASESLRWEAVRNDVLRTRRDPNGELSAIQIWSYLQEQEGWEPLSKTKMGVQLCVLMRELDGYTNALMHPFSRDVLLAVEHICGQIHRVTTAIRDGVDI